MLKKINLILVSLVFATSLSAKKVTVTVFPPDAVVYKNGVAIEGNNGVYGITVSIVDQTFVVKRDGFDPREFVVNMKSMNAFEVKLTPNRKEVRVSISPEEVNASIYIDGIKTDNAKFQVHKNEVKHVKVTADGYDTYSTNIRFADLKDLTDVLNVHLVANRRDIKIKTPVPADIYVNGDKIASAQESGTITLNKYDENLPVKVVAPGYLEYTGKVSFKDNLNVYEFKDLIVDEAYINSIGSGEETAKIANEWQDFAAHNMTREEALRRIASVLRNYSDEALSSDFVAGTISTPWLIRNFNSGHARTKIEVAETYNAFSDEPTFQFRIRSQFTKEKNPTDDDYKKWERVLKTYENVPKQLTSAVTNLMKKK